MTRQVLSHLRHRERQLVLALPALIGLLLWSSLLGQGFDHWSFDLPFLVRRAAAPQDAVIVYMDEKSFHDLHQEPHNWDRTLHAQLVERLTADHAKLVVFDIVFVDKATPQANAALAGAMRAHGNVALAATLSDDSRAGFLGRSLLLPLPDLIGAAAACGIADILGPGESCVRWYYPTNDLGPTLPWVAATLAGGAKGNVPADPSDKRWLNFYGPHGTIPNVSYSEVTNQLPGFFRDKVVFVGGGSRIPYAVDRADEYNTAFTRWTGIRFPGVEIVATAFLNLIRGDELRRMPALMELALLLGCGLILGTLAQLRPFTAGVLAAGSFALVSICAVALLWRSQIWFSWLTVAGAQIPVAFACSLLTHVRRVGKTTTVAAVVASSTAAAPSANEAVPTTREPLKPEPSTRFRPESSRVGDLSLVRCVGEGSYGHVWLARNAVGMYQAVKIVYRAAFENDAPYEREFKGIQKFMPVSLNHPGLVRLLHVGRNDAEGYFYYVMEAGDDEVSGPRIDPATYSPKNLAKELKRRKRLTVAESVELGLHLTGALQFLHENQLIHRDIKPSNIIYVNGAPKIADIGLVTDLGVPGRDVSYLGTQGYIPPEGPGSAAADVYSLGKVLYEASMGRNLYDFPDLPTSLVENPDDPALLRMNRIILKACESNCAARYPSADRMREDLLALQKELPATDAAAGGPGNN